MNKTLVAGALLLAAASISIHAQKDWTYYGQDQGATRFSTLAQITTDNVRNLTRAWTFHTGDKSGFFESTPLVIDSVMYFASGSAFFALDAVTGQQIWKVPAVRTTRRGVSYWPGDAKTPPRIIASAGTELFALDARTGAAIADFGDEGSVELEDSMNSPAAIYKDLAIVQGNKPWIRAFNVRSGKLEWTFHLIPQPGEKGHDTWDGESWKTAGGTNVWGLLSLDAPRGLVFLPVSMPGNNDYYGGDHHGDNLFGTSVVAVEAATGKLRWYRQLVHHDIWDYDLGAAPALVDVVKNGRTIPAVAEITKMGLMFVLDRTTGEPVWGIEERPVPQTTAPGEKTAPTQPFPVKPPPLARNSMTRAELATIAPEHEAYCKALWEKYKLQDSVPYQPWNDKQDIVLFPGAVGGGNWNGVTVNQPLGLMITNVMNAGQWGHLEAGAGGRDRRGEGRGAGTNNDETAPPAQTWRKVTPEGRRFWDPKTMYSCQAPPWGELIAVSTKTGDIAWRVPLGSFDALDAQGIKTGTPGLGGAITTAGNLVFIGATVDSKFRAFDARNGKELWSDKVEAPAHAIPSTYMGRDGRQYVVIAAGGGGFLQSPTSDTVVAYALAQPPEGRAATGSGQAGGRGNRGPRLRKVVLAWADTRNGIAQHDSVSHALAVIERLGYESGAYDTYIRTDSNIVAKAPLMTTGQPASGGPSLSNVDAIFFLGHRDVPLDDKQKAELAAFVHDEGKGFVAAHIALTAFESWPEFGELLGARYDGHPWGSAAGTVINEDPAFPATKHFGAMPFAFTDEFYQPKAFSREKAHVLLRLDVSKMPANQELHRTDGDFPLAWAKTYGKGRVFYSSLGHAASTWDNRDVQQMYLEAIKWALGMTDGDVTPRPYPGATK